MVRQLSILAVFLFCLSGIAQTSGSEANNAGIIQTGNLQTSVPPTVYFSGQTASVQLRNSAGIQWGPSKKSLFAMVDASGYSSGIRERYQFYILTDVAIQIADRTLQPGAYGAGFLENTGLLVMDLGGNELFHSATSDDPELKRPRPLQLVPAPKAGEYRLYLGRKYVTVAHH